MIVDKETIAEANCTEPLKVKCKNCMACEIHTAGLLAYNWCDFWSTTIDDAATAYCSFFVPLPIYPAKGEKTDVD